MSAAKLIALCALMCMGLAAAKLETVYNENQKFYEDTRLLSANVRSKMMTAVPCRKDSSLSRNCFVYGFTVDSGKKPSTSCTFLLDSSHDLQSISALPLTDKQNILVTMTRLKNTKEQFVDYLIVETKSNDPRCSLVSSAPFQIQFDSVVEARENFRENKDAILIDDDGSFYILHNDNGACGGKLCIVKIGADGNKLEGPTAFLTAEKGAKRYLQRGPIPKSFVVLEDKYDDSTKRHTHVISLVNDDGTSTQLKKYSSEDTLKTHDVSTSHDVIRVCVRREDDTTRVSCDVVNNNMYVVAFTPNKAFDEKQKVEHVAVENLRDGKYLLLIEGEDRDYVRKYGSDNTVDGVIQLFHFPRRPHYVYQSHFDVNANTYCVTRRGYYENSLKVLKECFIDADFQKP